MAANDKRDQLSVFKLCTQEQRQIGNNASVVTPGEVKTVRESSPKEIPVELPSRCEIFNFGRAERTNWDEKK